MNNLPDNFTFIDLKPSISDFKRDVVMGLRQSPKTIPPKYFYDQRGSQLYEKITLTREYYPTRTEMKIIQEFSNEISSACGRRLTVVELGCGSTEKIRLLLKALNEVACYLPIDISKNYLINEAAALAADHQGIKIKAICADFTQELDLEPFLPTEKNERLVFFPGSTIGNFHPDMRARLLSQVRKICGEGGRFLVGVDLKKDPSILNAAYNDKDGVTEDFNKNLLHRMKKDLGADVQPDQFSHKAFYAEEKGRVEMHLVSREKQAIEIGEEDIRLEKGETIHTESSYKFSRGEFKDLLEKAGFRTQKVWVDKEGLFSLHLALGA